MHTTITEEHVRNDGLLSITLTPPMVRPPTRKGWRAWWVNRHADRVTYLYRRVDDTYWTRRASAPSMVR